jgi:hypothetical protein
MNRRVFTSVLTAAATRISAGEEAIVGLLSVFTKFDHEIRSERIRVLWL